MKVAIGTEIREGPWGGGNAFANVLKIFLINENMKSFQIVQQLLTSVDPMRWGKTSKKLLR